MARLYLHSHEKGGNDAEKYRELIAKFNWRAANSQCAMPPPKAAAQRGARKNAARGIASPGLRIYEGRAERELAGQVKEMTQAGTRMIGLGALGNATETSGDRLEKEDVPCRSMDDAGHNEGQLMLANRAAKTLLDRKRGVIRRFNAWDQANLA